MLVGFSVGAWYASICLLFMFLAEQEMRRDLRWYDKAFFYVWPVSVPVLVGSAVLWGLGQAICHGIGRVRDGVFKKGER